MLLLSPTLKSIFLRLEGNSHYNNKYFLFSKNKKMVIYILTEDNDNNDNNDI